MKFPRFVAFLILVLGAPSLHAQLLSIFGNSVSSDGTWSYNSGTSTLTGTETVGNSLFGTPLASSISLGRQIRLTANVTVAPAGSFTITLEDNTGKVATALYQWTLFLGGAAQARPLNFIQSGFNFGSINGISLDSGGSGQALNVTLNEIRAVVPVPEPSTCAVGVAALLALGVLRRELGKRRVLARSR